MYTVPVQPRRLDIQIEVVGNFVQNHVECWTEFIPVSFIISYEMAISVPGGPDLMLHQARLRQLVK